MKQIVLVVSMILILSGIAFADKQITVTLTDEEYKAMSVLTSTPEEWSGNAIKNKAVKMVNELAEKYGEKQVSKMTEVEKKAVINSIDLEKEKELRTIKTK